MNKAIIGRKVGMTQLFTPEGKVIPVTVVEAGPCPVVQIKTIEKDGYCAVKLGFDETSEKRLSKPELGQFKKAGVAPQKVLREFRVENAASYEVGKTVTAETFKAGDHVDVVGTSKGHGFSGVIKRSNQRRLKETHGAVSYTHLSRRNCCVFRAGARVSSAPRECFPDIFRITPAAVRSRRV